MIYHLYLSAIAVVVCACVLGILKYISVSKLRLDNRDEKRKLRLTAKETLTLLRDVKPFPVGRYKGWKLHSFHNHSRVWVQEITPSSGGANLKVYGAFCKIRVTAQVILQLLKDVSRTTDWKPGVLATSITAKTPSDHDSGISWNKGVLGGNPVQRDIVTEESLPTSPSSVWDEIAQIFRYVFHQHNTLVTKTKEHRRFWHREDNGVCWLFQMSEFHQEWLFFLAQPVEDVEQSMLTVVSYMDSGSETAQARRVADILGSLSDYILHRKCQTTPLLDIKLPSTIHENSVLGRSLSSSDENTQLNHGASFDNKGAGSKVFMRFRSLVERPTYSNDRSQAQESELVRSVSILRHRTLSKGDGPKDLPNLAETKDKSGSPSRPRSKSDIMKSSSDMSKGDNSDTGKFSATDNNNVVKEEITEEEVEEEPVVEEDVKEMEKDKDIDSVLEEDITYEEGCLDEAIESDLQSSKSEVRHIVTANQTAAELLAVAVQASNLDLNKAQDEQPETSGGWKFCGLDSDVVVLKKVSNNDSVHCYLGKGIIQAPPRSVWDAIKNPRTRFTYDDSLKKVDVLQNITEKIKIVYYYHEVLQLFKKECCDMCVMQSEKVDGDKFVLAMHSVERDDVPSPDGAQRIKMLPSGWIIEPVQREKKVVSMATYIMQMEFVKARRGPDRSPFEDLISKQPMSIAYLRQYLRPAALWSQKIENKSQKL